MTLYEKLSDLPLRIEDYGFETLERDVSGGFTRVTSEIVLEGANEVGRGEDTTYEAAHHRDLVGMDVPVEGDFTVGEFSERIGDIDLFMGEPLRPSFENFRRWGFESAALDLALKQGGRTLAEALGGTYRPVRFVVSPRLGEPPSSDLVHRWLQLDPGLEFKLDATTEWTEGLAYDLAATDRVRIVDLKGMYEGVEVAQPADPDLYRMVVERFPDAFIEDPSVTEETRPVLEPVKERVTWDKPLEGVESLERLPFDPRVINVKPSRFGSLERVLETVEHCMESGIGMYGGGQFELGRGRDQVQVLASLFYPDSPNDVSPRAYHSGEPSRDAPSSPVEPPEDAAGFGW